MSTIQHILMTAGGTVEMIDGVRQISNTSTGSLCACIYEALADFLSEADSDPVFMVHYVVGQAAVRPEVKENLPISFYPVTDVASIESALHQLMTAYNIGYVIHGMAVSDFTKGYLIEQEELISELANVVEKVLKDNPEKLSGENLKALVRDVLKSPKGTLDVSSKVSSKAALMMALKQTPKLIGKIKKWNPETFLVGFKLLKGVREEELIRVAAEMGEKNGCNLVLANDMNSIHNGRHEGLLLQGNRVVGRYYTKKEIAEGIAGRMLSGATQTADAE